MTNLIVNIPFDGFYCSGPELRIDDAIISYFDAEGTGEDNTPEDFYASFDYSPIFPEYAKIYTKSFNEWMTDIGPDISEDLKIKFHSLTSPQFYNYETDRIYATMPLGAIKKLWCRIERDVLEKTIKDRFTSYDGFISFYSNDLEDWVKKPLKEWDANEIGTLLLAYIETRGETANCLDHVILEAQYGYEAIQNFIFDLCSRWEDKQG